MINFGLVANVVGVLLVVVGGFMLTALPFSFYFESGDVLPLLYSALVTAAVGQSSKRLARIHADVFRSIR